MTVHPPDTALLEYLRSKSALYYGKAIELREAVTGWLNYIPHSFPHYTRHTIEHSDEIVAQISNLLFEQAEASKPVITLSSVEAYILIAAAYLHDAGMVTPDREKIEILNSSAWKEWTTGDGGGTERWNQVQLLRNGPQPPDKVTRDFLADIQTRFLIAEFVRRVHHLRAKDVINQHETLLGRFAFNDAMLRRAISDVCIGHGLEKHELEDHVHYPDRTDIRGQKVNVQLMATLLRLGDLLDMTSDRACPLLLNAACPLPSDSPAHWSQYQRIVSRMTATDRIEIYAECENQEEHRLLQDWCQWLVDEVLNADRLMTRAHRHQEWKPPLATIGNSDSTIKIRPSLTATYIPSRWTFELDPDAVLNRLIHNVYEQPTAFIRELIQNALDATRCKMFADLVKENLVPPDSPTDVQEPWRTRYPIKLTLEKRDLLNALSGEPESRQVLIIEDPGIGMDREIIERYFLQVGRSYYTTEEFQRQFGFIPTSRFGVGFLSVFAVSNHVVVETLKSTSTNDDGPLRLTLTGPKNYLLTEKGTRTKDGTKIEVLLREPLKKDELLNLVSAWCRRVEFPIFVDELGNRRTVVSEKSADFTYEIPDFVDENASLLVRAFPVQRPGIEGELYVFAKTSKVGESWTEYGKYKNEYPKKYARAVTPDLPASIRCVHGIDTTEHIYQRDRRVERLDYRKAVPKVTLARSRMSRVHDSSESEKEIVSRWEEIIAEHLMTTPLADGDDSWKYKQALSDEFKLPTFWAPIPGMLRLLESGKPALVSLDWLNEKSSFSTAMQVSGTSQIPLPNIEGLVISHLDLRHLSDISREHIFGSRVLDSLVWLNPSLIVLNWIQGEDHGVERVAVSPDDRVNYKVSLLSLPVDIIGFEIHRTTRSYYDHIVMNSDNSVIQWLLRFRDFCSEEMDSLRVRQFQTVRDLLMKAISYQYLETERSFSVYLAQLREFGDLPPQLVPPNIETTREMFKPRNS